MSDYQNWRTITDALGRKAIRNDAGLICSFNPPSKYPDQEERYQKEIEQMNRHIALMINSPKLLGALIAAKNRIRKCFNELSEEWLLEHDEEYRMIHEAIEIVKN